MAIVILLIIVAMYNFLILPWLMHWGATKEEFDRTLPGDELVVNKDYKNTLTDTINASPSQIWPWVVQMGVHKAGFYSYAWLENIFGCKLHNADRIHPEWQDTQPGYYEGVCQAAEKKGMPGWIVTIVEPGKAFVWKGKDADWMMGVYIDSINQNTSRIITRQQFKMPKCWSFKWIIEKIWFSWAHCIMQRGMIMGIKQRVEGKLVK